MQKEIIRTPILDPQMFKEVLDIAYYYGKKRAKIYHLSSFNAISRKDPYHHKNWKYFNELYDLCKKFNIDFKEYIDAQFHRATYWKSSSDKVIYPHQLCTPLGIDYYYKYIEENF